MDFKELIYKIIDNQIEELDLEYLNNQELGDNMNKMIINAITNQQSPLINSATN